MAKARSFMTLRDSKDPVNNIQPYVKTGRKRKAKYAVEEAESRLKHKEMVGATQVGRQGLGLINHKVIIFIEGTSCYGHTGSKRGRRGEKGCQSCRPITTRGMDTLGKR